MLNTSHAISLNKTPLLADQSNESAIKSAITNAAWGPIDNVLDSNDSGSLRSNISGLTEPSKALPTGLKSMSLQGDNIPPLESPDYPTLAREFSYAASERPSIVGPDAPHGDEQSISPVPKLQESIIKRKPLKLQIKKPRSTVSFEDIPSPCSQDTSQLLKRLAKSLANEADLNWPLISSGPLADDNGSQSTKETHSHVQNDMYIDGTTKSSKPGMNLSIVTEDQHHSTSDQTSVAEGSPGPSSTFQQRHSQLGTQCGEENARFDFQSGIDDWMYKQELSKISPKVTEVEDIGSRSPSVGTSLLPFTLLATHSLFDAMLGLLGYIVEGYQTPNIPKDHVRVRWTCVIAPLL